MLMNVNNINNAKSLESITKLVDWTIRKKMGEVGSD